MQFKAVGLLLSTIDVHSYTMATLSSNDQICWWVRKY